MRLIFVCLFLFSLTVKAEDIEEAIGLKDSPSEISDLTKSKKSKPVSKLENEKWRSRSYLLLESVTQKTSDGDKSEFPNLEASLSLDYKKNPSMTFFIDVMGDYFKKTNESSAFTNQIGLRYTGVENMVFALGKERNRRSPGIIVSPSDPLFVFTNLPGQREDRRGVWLARASYQQSRSSYDLFLLPADQMDGGGWPMSQSKYQGTLGRMFQQFENWDLSLSAGEMDKTSKAGLALQSIFADVWKGYYELGYIGKYSSAMQAERKDVTQHLLGISYEGSEDYTFKAEYFFNGQGMDNTEFQTFRRTLLLSPTIASASSDFSPFLRKQYMIFSAAAIEVKNYFNFILSGIKSIEDTASLYLLRAEFLATNQLVIGGSALYLDGDNGTQYFLRSFDRQYSLDLKYSF